MKLNFLLPLVLHGGIAAVVGTQLIQPAQAGVLQNNSAEKMLVQPTLSKQAQCKVLLKEVGKSAELAKKIEAQGKNIEKAFNRVKNFNEFKRASRQASITMTELDSDVAMLRYKVASVGLQDINLINFQERYIENLSDLSTALKDMANVLDKIQNIQETPQGSQESQKIAQELDGISDRFKTESKEEKKTLNELTKYCKVSR